MPPSAHDPLPRSPWWLWANVLSLDAPLVAVVWQASLAQVCGVALPPACYLSLGITVWLIYVMDRVLDGFSAAHYGIIPTARHRFYRRYRWLFLLVLVPAGAVWLLYIALTQLPQGILWRGVGLMPVVGVYLLQFAVAGRGPVHVLGNLLAVSLGLVLLYALPLPLVPKFIDIVLLIVLLIFGSGGQSNKGPRLVPKELICGYLFALGCALSVNFYSMDASAGPVSYETLQLAVLCTLNCVVISYFEREADAAGGRRGITGTWPDVGRAYPMLLFGLAWVIGFMFSRDLPKEMILYAFAVLASLALLGVVYRRAKNYSAELAHVLADVAVALPLGLLLLLG